MNLRHYVLIFGFGTGIAALAWLLVVFNVNPITAGAPGVFLFLLTLFVTIVGFFTTVETYIRGRKNQDDLEPKIKTALRQSVLLGLIVVGALLLTKSGHFTWWTLVLLLILAVLLEYSAVQGQSRANDR